VLLKNLISRQLNQNTKPKFHPNQLLKDIIEKKKEYGYEKKERIKGRKKSKEKKSRTVTPK